MLKTPSCTPERAAELTHSILNMIVADMRPLSMVADSGFKAMISTFHPKYELPSRTFFTTQMEKKYEGIMMQALQETSSVALTTDIWTSCNRGLYGGDMPLSWDELENGVPLLDNNATR